MSILFPPGRVSGDFPGLFFHRRSLRRFFRDSAGGSSSAESERARDSAGSGSGVRKSTRLWRGWKMKPLCLPQRLEGSKKSIFFSTGGVSGVLPGLRRRWKSYITDELFPLFKFTLTYQNGFPPKACGNYRSEGRFFIHFFPRKSLG
jgi:hypothetical protein